MPGGRGTQRPPRGSEPGRWAGDGLSTLQMPSGRIWMDYCRKGDFEGRVSWLVLVQRELADKWRLSWGGRSSEVGVSWDSELPALCPGSADRPGEAGPELTQTCAGRKVGVGDIVEGESQARCTQHPPGYYR